jgi:hypothetical protein
VTGVIAVGAWSGVVTLLLLKLTGALTGLKRRPRKKPRARYRAAQREGLQPLAVQSAHAAARIHPLLRRGAAAGAAPVAAIVDAAIDATPHFYTRTRLIDSRGAPLRAAKVPPHRNLIFHYPYDTTPCFLLNLGRRSARRARLKTADQRSYEWKGGVGAGRSLVAYSAICAHQLAYPTRDISFISYRHRAQRGQSTRQRHPLLRRAQPI